MAVNWPAIGAVALPNLGGCISAAATKDVKKGWYVGLKKPQWTPPDWAFGPAWIGIYSGIGYASYIVWKEGGGFEGDAKLPLAVYATNLALNWAWTPIFFTKRNPKIAFYEINLVSATAVATGILFHRISPIAGYIFIPYVLWLGFATALNYKIWKDNEDESEPKIVEVKDNKDK